MQAKHQFETSHGSTSVLMFDALSQTMINPRMSVGANHKQKPEDNVARVSLDLSGLLKKSALKGLRDQKNSKSSSN